jgi:hypothetical protein
VHVNVSKPFVAALAALGFGVCTSSTRNSLAADAPAPEPTSSDAGGGRLARNSIFLEGLGPALLYSINYERVVAGGLAAARLGFDYVSVGASSATSAGTVSARASFLSIPMTASYLGLRSGKHVLELGAGATLVNTSGSIVVFGNGLARSRTSGLGEAVVGYRMHPVDGAGIQLRVGATVLFGNGLSLSKLADPDTFGVLPWPYASVGASF